MIPLCRNPKTRTLPLLIITAGFVIFLLLVYSYQPVQTILEFNEVPKHKIVGNLPGAYLKNYIPTEYGYCNFHFGLPTELVTNVKTDFQGTPEMGLNSSFRVLYNVIEGQMASTDPGLTFVTHLTEDFVWYLAEIVRFWEGPISVAVYVPNGNPQYILESMLHMCYCSPGMSRVSLHIITKKDVRLQFYLSTIMPPKTCDTKNLMNPPPSPPANTTSDINNKEEWYPINVCRNVAREAAYTKFVLVCDVELMPSEGLASRFLDMSESYACLEPPCESKIFVIPIFEVDISEDVPRTKKQLLDLLSIEKSVYFHQLLCPHCQRFPGLEQWKESDPGDIVKPLLETKRERPYHRWEPIYIGTKDEPLYVEGLSWEGFQDKMLQMLEICLNNYKLVILDGAYLVHWPGIKSKTSRPDETWRKPYREMNQKVYGAALKKIIKNHKENVHCAVDARA